MTGNSNVTQINQFVDENETSRRRRAINRALSAYMTEPQLLDALWLWEHGYAQGSAFELADFLHVICNTAELRVKQSEIRRSLIRHMAQPLKDLGPDPWPLMRDYAFAAKGAASSKTKHPDTLIAGAPIAEVSEANPATGVMLFVLGHVLDGMLNRNPAYAARMRKWLATNLQTLKLPQGSKELASWLLHQTALPVSAMRNEDMRRVVNLLYVGACEFFGPNLADTMLHEAIHAAESLPAARHFAPKELL
jgi:hypothetical protein